MFSQPPPPPWLNEAMALLRSRHPDSDFGPLMRPYTIDATTNLVQKASVEAGDAAPHGSKFQYLPKIKCYVRRPSPPPISSFY